MVVAPMVECNYRCHNCNLLLSLIYRDLVHRQTAMAAIGHLALGVYGFGCEDALTHLLNYLWPNVFESSPHVVQAFMACMEGMRIGLGPAKILQYSLQVSLLKLLTALLVSIIWHLLSGSRFLKRYSKVLHRQLLSRGLVLKTHLFWTGL